MLMLTRRRLVLLLAYMAILAYTSLKGHYPEAIQTLFEKIGSLTLHALAYFFLTTLVYWLFVKDARKGHILAFVFAFLYGLVLETAQIWVPTRDFSAEDILVNMAASATGALVSKLIACRKGDRFSLCSQKRFGE